jgi:hypothetical protein
VDAFFAKILKICIFFHRQAEVVVRKEVTKNRRQNTGDRSQEPGGRRADIRSSGYQAVGIRKSGYQGALGFAIFLVILRESALILRLRSGRRLRLLTISSCSFVVNFSTGLQDKQVYRR